MAYVIKKPCSEDWNKMTPVEGGRFCDHCSKKVHDLTNGSLLPATGDDLCGRIRVPKTKRVSFKKFLFRQNPIKFFALLFVLFFNNKVKAQLNKIQVDSLLLLKDSEFEDDNVITVSGIVENERTGQPVPLGFVTLYDSQKNILKVTRTGPKGEFSFLALRKHLADSLFSIKIEYIGMETLEITDIPITKKEIKMYVRTETRETYMGMMGGLIVSQAPTLLQGVTNSDYRHLPNKDIIEIAKMMSNAPVMGR